MPKDVNQQILDGILRHQHFVRAYENYILKSEILPILNKAKSDMLKKYNDFGKRIGRKKLSKLTKQERAMLGVKMRELDGLIKVANRKISGVMDKRLLPFAKSEQRLYRGLISDAFPIDIGLNRLPLEQLEKLVEEPLGGHKYADRLKKNYGDAVGAMKREIGVAILKGESMVQVRNRLIGVGKDVGGKVGVLIGNRAAMIARSEIMRVSNAVLDRLYQENQDILKGVQWVAVLDSRTCAQCAPLDSTFYDYSKGERAPIRPLHVFCRCVTVPITKSWKELGDDSKMAKKMDKLDPGVRATMTGYVPAKVKYPKWFDSQPDSFKRKVLGKSRFALYKSKGLSYKRMIKNGRWITLKDLAKLR